MTEYDITAAFRAIENELIASMIRNMDRHRAEETKEGYEWSMWQAEQLKELEKYKKANSKRFQKKFSRLNEIAEELIRQAKEKGGMDQEIEILKAIRNGFQGAKRADRGALGEFFKLNEDKLEALVKATTDDMKKAETAVLRMANDQYRKAIFNAQVYANTGAGTYEKAVDMAVQDMLAAGLNCVEYKNGARHTLSDYADMVIRTASKRAYLQGEGEKRKEWGISTVIVNKRGNPCPKCLPFCGKVLIDDVWSGGKKEDGPYPLMSKAVEAGLYHPRCKDAHTTYFPGISTMDDTWTKEELEAIGQGNRQEVRQQHVKRQQEKYERLAKYSLDAEDKRRYQRIAGEWEERADVFKRVKRKIEQTSEHEPVSIDNINSEYKNDIMHAIDQTPDSIRRFLQKHRQEIVFTNEKARIGNRENFRGIRVNLKKDAVDKRGKWCGVFHEIGHRVDRLAGRPSENPEFERALRNDFERLVNEYQKLYNVDRFKAYKEMGEMVQDPQYHSISDLLGGMSDNRLVGSYLHDSPNYWKKEGRLGREAFAHFFEAVSRNDYRKMEILKQTFPEAYRIFENMLEELE